MYSRKFTGVSSHTVAAANVHTPQAGMSLWTVILVTSLVIMIIFWAVSYRNNKKLINQAGDAEGKPLTRKGTMQTPNNDKVDTDTLFPVVGPDSINITFDDVAGIEEVKDELEDILDYMRNPDKYNRLGARIPTGVILYGPPGTGKTMVAKAMARHAQARFIQTNGSVFINKYLGASADRVRALFTKAREKSPTIVFIDEVDSIAGHRGGAQGHREYDMAINQLLTEMDGFATNKSKYPVIVVAATNRLDMIDRAMLRPGRFDRHVAVNRPDIEGRFRILNVHMKNKPPGEDVDLREIARRTIQFSGADLANICNEAAILAAKGNQETVSQANLVGSIDRVLAGIESRRMLTDEERMKVAYHELGHAVATHMLGFHEVRKITIIPRGSALGYVHATPPKDTLLADQDEIEAMIIKALGGRAAEMVFFGKASTGAASDFQNAYSYATSMVCEYGMSDLGIVVLDSKNPPAEAREEIHKILNRLQKDSIKLIQKNADLIRYIAPTLLERETIDRNEFLRLIEEYENSAYAQKILPTPR